jgi:hypothetical protein
MMSLHALLKVSGPDGIMASFLQNIFPLSNNFLHPLKGVLQKRKYQWRNSIYSIKKGYET